MPDRAPAAFDSHALAFGDIGSRLFERKGPTFAKTSAASATYGQLVDIREISLRGIRHI
mgnify:CR=1 FL=1